MKLTNLQKWLRTIAWLRRTFPTQYPVTVQSTRKIQNLGEIVFIGKRFLIRIKRDKPIDMRIGALLHEWAHALTWFGAQANEDHSAEWGLAHTSIYDAWLKWDWRQNDKSKKTPTVSG